MEIAVFESGSGKKEIEHSMRVIEKRLIQELFTAVRARLKETNEGYTAQGLAIVGSHP